MLRIVVTTDENTVVKNINVIFKDNIGEIFNVAKLKCDKIIKVNFLNA